MEFIIGAVILWVVVSAFGSGGSSGGDKFANANQRGNRVEITTEDGRTIYIEGDLRGWSSSSVSFIHPDGTSAAYKSNGSIEYYY